MVLYRKEGQDIKANSFAYANLQKNRTKLTEKQFVYVYDILFNGIMNTVMDAAKLKNEQLLDTAIIAYNQLPENVAPLHKDEIYKQYYQRSGEKDKHLKYAMNFCNNKLTKVSDDTIAQRDRVIGAISYSDPTLENSRICIDLNNYAWEVFGNVLDKNILKDALGWSKRSLELSPNNSIFLDTYANLLYKLGRKKEAIVKEGESLRYADKKDVEKYKATEETLRKMKKVPECQIKVDLAGNKL